MFTDFGLNGTYVTDTSKFSYKQLTGFRLINLKSHIS